jgi:hypothetical protein
MHEIVAQLDDWIERAKKARDLLMSMSINGAGGTATRHPDILPRAVAWSPPPEEPAAALPSPHLMRQSRQTLRDEILSTLAKQPKTPMSLKDLQRHTSAGELSTDVLRRVIYTLTRAGQLRPAGRGRYRLAKPSSS